MSKSPRVHTAEFKARVALAACKGDRTLSEIAAQYEVHVKLVQGWKKQMLDGAAMVFSRTDKPVSSKEAEAKQIELFEQIGRLKMELEWLKKKSSAFL
jgi:transposase